MSRRGDISGEEILSISTYYRANSQIRLYIVYISLFQLVDINIIKNTPLPVDI